MIAIHYPDPESVDEITARYLLSLPTTLMPMLYGFRFDGRVIDADCAAVDLTGERSEYESNPIHLRAADLRNILGPGMFGFGLVFVVFADQLADRPENRHIPEQVRAAAEQLPGESDLIVAAIIDATGRQWWAVVGRYLTELEPVRIHLPATPPNQWRITPALDVSLWTAALALDEANHPHLLRLRTASRP
ncbi:hypothetical protein [Nocardia jinanensis]|uniref:Uncharacterized protein n=1 Tax=Nocardia jinanensis TaxID=382504 RepID=A0A917RUN3_9NOCA|nr:hypothetical protein [Nocardia jinanensis]GGL32407.1 hypothetical protein GCM10011588_54010 [Nocardia jinanensis]